MQRVITMVYAPFSFRYHTLFVYHDHTLFVLWSHIMCASWSQTNYLLWSQIMYVSRSCPKSGNAWRLKSRHSFVPAAQQFTSSSDNNIRSAALWEDHRWNAKWLDNTTRLCTFIPDTGTHSPEMTLPRTAWVRLNRLRIGFWRFRSCLYDWDMTRLVTSLGH